MGMRKQASEKGNKYQLRNRTEIDVTRPDTD